MTLELNRSRKSRNLSGLARGREGAGWGCGMSCGNSMCRRGELWHSSELTADTRGAEIHLSGSLSQTQAEPWRRDARSPKHALLLSLAPQSRVWGQPCPGGDPEETPLLDWEHRGLRIPSESPESWQGRCRADTAAVCRKSPTLSESRISHLGSTPNWPHGLTSTRQRLLDSVFFSVKWGWKLPLPGGFQMHLRALCCRNLIPCGFR